MLIINLEMIKKINGYRIFMNKKIGKGAFGTVTHTNNHRSTKASKPAHQYPAP
jgi:hypothetical protein